MASVGREYQVLFSYLKSLNFHYLDTWVIECVNYYKSTNPNISLEKLKNEVKQQWLLVNLREIKVPSLPPNLASKEKIILEGKYAVQVESMIDCSESCYSQYQRLRKVCNENIEATKEPKDWDIKSSRCLTFTVSDGVQHLKAMEYEPIKKIRTNDPELLPGFKMVIMGPVECRKGMILLKDENIRICGGEVDVLTNHNDLKSILIRKLDLSDTDFPNNSEGDSGNDVAEIQSAAEPRPESSNNQNVERLLSQNDDIFLSLPLEPDLLGEAPQSNLYETNSGNARVSNEMDVSYINNNENNEFSELNQDNVFDDIFSSVNKKHELSEDEMFISNRKKLSLDPEVQNSVEFLAPASSSYMEVDDDIFIEDEPPMRMNFNQSKIDVSVPKKTVQTKLSSFFKNNDSPITSPANSLRRTSTAIDKPKDPICIDTEPFIYLKQIMSTELKRPVVFTIKAIILTLTKKIVIENDSFSLTANITDGSACVTADFSSMIVEDILEYSPCEMQVLMKRKLTNSAVADRVKNIFSKAQEKLISLNCLMKIEFYPENKNPLIVSLEEVNVQHLNAIKKRCIEKS